MNAPVFDPNGSVPYYPCSPTPTAVEECFPNRVFVGGFGPKTTEADIRHLFETICNVREVKMIRCGEEYSRGYGFLTLDSEKDVEELLAIHLKTPERLVVNGRQLNLGRAIRKVAQYPVEYITIGPNRTVEAGRCAYFPIPNGIQPYHTLPAPYNSQFMYAHHGQYYYVSGMPQRYSLQTNNGDCKQYGTAFRGKYGGAEPFMPYQPDCGAAHIMQPPSAPAGVHYHYDPSHNMNNNCFTFNTTSYPHKTATEVSKVVTSTSSNQEMNELSDSCYNTAFPSLSQSAAGDAPAKWKPGTQKVCQSLVTPTRRVDSLQPAGVTKRECVKGNEAQTPPATTDAETVKPASTAVRRINVAASADHPIQSTTARMNSGHSYCAPYGGGTGFPSTGSGGYYRRNNGGYSRFGNRRYAFNNMDKGFNNNNYRYQSGDANFKPFMPRSRAYQNTNMQTEIATVTQAVNDVKISPKEPLACNSNSVSRPPSPADAPAVSSNVESTVLSN